MFGETGSHEVFEDNHLAGDEIIE